MAQGSSEIGQESATAEGKSANLSDSAPTSNEIRSEIEQTRAEMTQTIDAIQARLSPRRLVIDARETIMEATVGRVKRLAQRSAYSGRQSRNGRSTVGNMLQTARQNPFPVAAIGVTAMAVLLLAFTRSRTGINARPRNRIREIRRKV